MAGGRWNLAASSCLGLGVGEPAVQAHDVLAGRRLGPLDHLSDGRILAGDLLALVVREGVDVQQQRLLDLRVVEEVAEALGRELGMVRQHDRRPEHRPVLVAQQDREGVDGLAGERRLPLRPLPLERGDEAVRSRPRAAGGWRSGCGEEPRRERPRPGRQDVAVSLCTQRRTLARVGESSSARMRDAAAELAAIVEREDEGLANRLPAPAPRGSPGRARASARPPRAAPPWPAGTERCR